MTATAPTVTFVMGYAHPTMGMERVALDLVSELAAGGIGDVSVEVLSGPAPDLPGVSGRTHGGHPARLREVVYLRRLLGLGRGRDGDVTVVVGAWVAIPYLLLGLARRRRTVIWEHSLVPEKVASSRSLRVLARFARRLYRRADSVVVVSEPVRRYVEQLCPGVAVAVIPNIVRTGAARQHLGAGTGRLLAVGSLTATKRHALAIAAIAELPDRYTLDIVGEGPKRAELESQVDHLGLQDRVRLTGYLENADVLGLMAGSEALVHVAQGETFGMVYFEAADAGLPVVTTQHPISSWLVPAYVPGVVVDDGRASEVAAAVLGCDPDPDEVAAARSRRARDFSPEAVRRAWDDLISTEGKVLR